MSDIWSLNALCRCCHTDGNFKSLNLSYTYGGEIEVYSDMLHNTLGLFVNKPLIEASYSICDNCITQLRSASQFKKQVVECELKFEDYCKNELAQQSEIKLENIDGDEVMIKSENRIKIEDYASEYHDYGYTHIEHTNANTKNFVDPNEVYEEKKPNAEIKYKDSSLEKQKLDHLAKQKPGNARSKTTSHNRVPFKRVKTQSGEIYVCQTCKTSFKSLKRLRLHIAKNHTRKFTCTICNKRFNREHLLKIHKLNHNPVSLHKCDICGKTYKWLRSMLEHKNTHTKENVFICNICNKNFTYKSALRTHIGWHNGTNKKFMCDICGNSFNDKSNLNIHFRNVHEKLRLFKCDLCPKTYAANKTLKIHYRTHTGERPYKCELCDKTFLCSSALGNHRKIHANMAKLGGKYLCKVCGAVYDHRGGFAAHTRSHIGAKPHKCHICDKDFTCHYSLKRHIDIHQGIKRFSCDICHTKFCGKSQLQRHFRNLHDPSKTKKPKIKCDLCKMTVTDMEKHMKCHTNRALQCGYCPKSYSERNALNRHIRQTHSGVSYDCDICGKKYVKLGSLQSHKLKKHNIQIKDEEEKISQLQCEENSLEQF